MSTSRIATKRPLAAEQPRPGVTGTPRTVETVWRRGAVAVTPGAELSVRGIRGRVKFRAHVILADGREWVDVVHPEYGFYSVRPARVRVVHRRKTTRPVGATTRAAVAAPQRLARGAAA